ncbi:hypothetical protein AKJ16_DCAP27555 [Drosera capensis]
MEASWLPWQRGYRQLVLELLCQRTGSCFSES